MSNPISQSLKFRLENAFEDLKMNHINPLIIAQIKNEEFQSSVYLIAKDPERDMYYGIVENEFISEREMMGIPLSNICGLGYVEIPINPFRAKPYVEAGIKSI